VGHSVYVRYFVASFVMCCVLGEIMKLSAACG